MFRLRFSVFTFICTTHQSLPVYLWVKATFDVVPMRLLSIVTWLIIEQSKSVFSAFKEARMAYRTRKAEIAEERARQSARRDEARLRAARKHSTARRLERSNTGQLMIEDDEERRQRKKEKKEKKKRSESSSPSGTGSDSGTSSDISFEDDSGGTVLTTTNNNSVRRSTSSDTMRTEATLYTPGGLRGNMSVISLIPEMVLSQPDPMTENLQLLLLQLQATIDELSCWSAGIGALISELQKVPDTLAVVGLTLAEVSALVAKVSPAAIMGLKTLFPMIFALLGSPQFVVLAGVGAAATVIVLGGYKIIKNVVGGAAKASLSAGDEDEYPEGDWDEPVEEVVREPPQQRMIEAAPIPQPETRRTQSQAPTQRKQLMPARAHTFQAPASGSEVLAFDISSTASSSGESSNNSSNSNSNSNSADEEEDKKRHHRKRRGSNDKLDKDKSERSRSKSGSSSHHSKSKSDKEKDKSEKDKSSSKSGKHESSESSGRRGSSSKSHDKSDKKERKTSADSGTTTPPKEKKAFFSLTTSPFSSPAASTTSLPTEKQKKKERKSSLSSTSSPSSDSKEKEKEKEKEKTTSTKEHKETKKPKDLLLGLFEGRSA